MYSASMEDDHRALGNGDLVRGVHINVWMIVNHTEKGRIRESHEDAETVVVSASVHVISLLLASFLRLDNDRLKERVLLGENVVGNEQ